MLNFAKAGSYLLLSFVLGVLTLFGLGALNHLPYSPIRDAFSDALTFPGGVIASLFYPEGIHTGRGSPGAAYVAFAGNAVVYALLWFFAIQIVRRIRAGGLAHPSSRE